MARKPTPPAIPTHGAIKKPLLGLLRQRGEVSLAEALAFIADHFRLSAADRTRKQKCGKETVLQNRLRWARWELQREGRIRTTRRGYFAAADSSFPTNK